MKAVIWLTGLPCSGKTTQAKAASEILRQQGIDTEILDGDEFRARYMHGRLGFSSDDRTRNVAAAATVAAALARKDLVVICAFVSPQRYMRESAREIVAADGIPFFEVFVSAHVKVCMQRDVKGLWAKAQAGEIRDFTGWDAPYETPESPDLVIDTSLEGWKQCATRIVRLLEEL